MRLTLTMELDNAAFSDEWCSREDGERSGDAVADVLRRLACEYGGAWLEAGDTETLRDANGNKIGAAVVTD